MRRQCETRKMSIFWCAARDFPAVVAAMEAAGFFHAEVLGVEMFLDGPNASPRDAVHILFAGEKFGPSTPRRRPMSANRKRAPNFGRCNWNLWCG